MPGSGFFNASYNFDLKGYGCKIVEGSRLTA
jgi:hypothetical protein